MVRTFSRSDWDAAQRGWSDGQFSPEWRDLRRRMAEQGCIFPPSGDRYDSWEDDSPSQRAILIRAVRETPELLARCARGARSWHELVSRLARARDEWREEQSAEELEQRRLNAAGPSRTAAAESLAAILGRITS